MIESGVYRAMIENALDAFFLTDINGYVYDANNAACEMFGYTLEEIKGVERKQIIDLSSPGLEECLKIREEKGKVTCELIGIKSNGEKFPIWVSSVLFSESSDNPKTFTIIHDITELKKKEKQLDELEMNMRVVMNNTDELFIILDKDLKIVNFNKATEEKSKQLLGVPFEKGRSILDSVSPERKGLLKELYVDVLNGAVRKNTVEIPPTDQHPKFIVEIRYAPIFENGQVNGVIINVHDVTEAKEKEAALLKANERFFYATKATNDAIWDWDIQNDHVFRVGDGLKSMFGYDIKEAEVEKEFWINRVHPDDLKKMIDKRTDILYHSNELYWEDEYRFRRKDGTYAYVFDKGYIIRSAEGNPIRMIGATQDVSQRRESESLLLELNNRMKKRAEELSNSNIELERFAYVASHDLQEPLRMITSFLQLLQKRYKDKIDETANQYINFAIDGAERMKVLIMDLLDYSRVGSSVEVFQEVDLNVLLGELQGIFSKTCEEKNGIIRIGQMPVLRANKTQLFQLFQNLVSNALKYHSERSPEVEIGYEEKETEYQFVIKDNGIGIDPNFHEKIFIIFHRLHSRTEYGGTGIGLAVCKKIVERHGGRIWVESAPGKGSSFYFTLAKRI